MSFQQAEFLSKKIESFPIEQTPRMHLGASEIGGDCLLEAWFSFRWVAIPNNSNQSLRLLDRGDREEIVFEELLKKAGCTVFTRDITTGEQFRISDFDGHFGGSLDGIVFGVEDMPNEWMLGEFKTSEYKSFRILHGYNGKTKKYDTKLGKGVRLTHPKHYAQMQIYMHYKGLKFALYCSVNKNDDTLHFEIVPYNPTVISKLQEKAHTAIYSKTKPKRITNNPSDFKCIFCKQKGVCQLNETPARNCRSCEFVEMIPDGKWKCGLTNELKTKKELLNGCNTYKLNSAIA